MAVYNFVSPREPKFCGILLCAFDKLACNAGE
jgi:hypothetical protein